MSKPQEWWRVVAGKPQEWWLAEPGCDCSGFFAVEYEVGDEDFEGYKDSIRVIEYSAYEKLKAENEILNSEVNRHRVTEGKLREELALAKADKICGGEK